jgi:AraC-like DNA-binding protein
METVYAPQSLFWAQLERGEFAMQHALLDAPPLEVSLRSFNLGFKAEATVAPQKTIIGLLADSRTSARWFGARVDKGTIAASKTFVDVRTEGAGSFYQIGVDAAALVRKFPDAPDALALIENTREVARAQDPLHAALLRSCVHRLFAMGSKNAALFPHGLPPQVISGTLIPLLAAAAENIDDRALEPSKSLSRRLSAVRRCEAYMREHIDATVTLLDLSRVCAMRSRSLINAFEAVTGFTPMDYLKRLRLHGVRRTLARADKARTRIIDVATAWGFWHMGHFAADYRAMFGEAPSQTLLK